MPCTDGDAILLLGAARKVSMFKKLKHGVPEKRLDFLRAVPMFEGLPDKALARIDSEVDEVDMAAGSDLTVQGAGSYEAFIIAEGTAEVRIGEEVVRETTVGEMIGELGILKREPRTATVTAKTPMRLLVVHPRRLEWLRSDPVLARRLQENLERHTGAPE